MAEYINFDYLKEYKAKSGIITYKILLGNRSIGKTHGVVQHLYDLQKGLEGITMILRRKKTELDFKNFCDKYGKYIGKLEWEWRNGYIYEGIRPIFAYNALSLAERRKNQSWDNPYVSNILIDEVYTLKPNPDELTELQTWIGTLARRTNHPASPIDVWLLGNYQHGVSPILEGLKVPYHKAKTKGDNFAIINSDMDSPENVPNYKSPYLSDKIDEGKGNLIYKFVFEGVKLAAFEEPYRIHIQETANASAVLSPDDMKILLRLIRSKGKLTAYGNKAIYFVHKHRWLV